MTTHELLALLCKYAADGCLATVVKNAIAKLTARTSVKVVLGEVQPHDRLLNTYKGRLRRSMACGTTIPGLPETVESLKNVSGEIRGGYAETDDGLVYFWIDSDGGLVGCIIKHRQEFPNQP